VVCGVCVAFSRHLLKEGDTVDAVASERKIEEGLIRATTKKVTIYLTTPWSGEGGVARG
jgi:hypothetical protein